ncbi:MAG: hypothetical protein ACKO23_13860, partial [Gemmataceae bacterium]
FVFRFGQKGTGDKEKGDFHNAILLRQDGRVAVYDGNQMTPWIKPESLHSVSEFNTLRLEVVKRVIRLKVNGEQVFEVPSVRYIPANVVLWVYPEETPFEVCFRRMKLVKLPESAADSAPSPTPPSPPVKEPSPSNKVETGKWLPLLASEDSSSDGGLRLPGNRPSASGSFRGNVLTLTDGATYLDSRVARNMVVRADVQRIRAKPANGNHANLRVRGGNGSNYLLWFNVTDDPRKGLFGMGMSTGNGYRNLHDGVLVDLSGPNRCSLALSVVNETITMWVDGKWIGRSRDSTLSEGRAGFGSTMATGIFRNPEIFFLDGTGITPAEALKR